jgi:hypothetical protein
VFGSVESDTDAITGVNTAPPHASQIRPQPLQTPKERFIKRKLVQQQPRQ